MADPAGETHGARTSQPSNDNIRRPQKNINAYPRLLAELRAALSDPDLTQKLLVISGHMIAADAERFEFYCAQTEQQLEPTFIQANKLHLRGFRNQGFILLEATQNASTFEAALFVRIGERDSRYYGAFRRKAISLSHCQPVYKRSGLIKGRQASSRAEKHLRDQYVAKATTIPEIGDEGFGASFMPSLSAKKKYRRRSLLHSSDSHAGPSVNSDTSIASAADTMRSIERMNINTSDVDSSVGTIVNQSPPRERESREGSQDAAMHSMIRGLAGQEVSQHNHRTRINDDTTLIPPARSSSAAQHAAKSTRPRLPQARKQLLHLQPVVVQRHPQTRSPELGSSRPSTFSIPSSTPGPRESIERPTDCNNASTITRPPVFINPAGNLDPSKVLVEFLSSDNDRLRVTSWQHCSQPEAFFAHALAAFSSLTSETIKFAVFKVVMDGEEKGAFRVMNGVKGDVDHLVARVRMFWDQLRADEEGFTVAVSLA